MTVSTHENRRKPIRVTEQLSGVAGHLATSDLVAFAERIVGASAGSGVSGMTLHRLWPGGSTRVTGEAECLSDGSAAIWRVAIADDAGTPVADVTLTLTDRARTQDKPADVVPLAPALSPDPESRRAQIARAARDVFAEKGYAAATMREIAAAAGMHVPTMYQYIRSKEETLELVYSWTINQAVDEMQAVLEASGPADERLAAIVRHLHDVNLKLRRGTLVMNRETRSLSPKARERVLGHYSKMVRRIGDVIAEGIAEGVFRPRDPQVVAIFIDALADVWVLRPFAVGHADPDDYAAELVAFVRDALMRCPSTDPDEPGP